ncbi:MAG: Ppx/GppA family phosphatase [Alphaproteobacteria bacterium]|nr:Ppx/GppA family phosphatase [Alphaproteobacteria bacterium]MBU0797851.1 Ppx/GppA family phosphatase [Alphaproteobacteria bacterium]MBU0886702.1 Ppx/GppA family phosphatase [Alphaproteobacteria bacterium]MBU1814557.1 Ppx/GppA family phosphatase [Alphaproteobacteria bacterium]
MQAKPTSAEPLPQANDAREVGGTGARSVAAQKGRSGVLDIGSNSIRLVVYDRHDRVLLPLFNEKALCGLGKGMNGHRRLSEEGVRSAFDNLARFAAIARAMEVSSLFVLATAAVRDAENGPDFVAEVEKRLGFKVTILSGEEEARLSAMGVLCAMPQADGVVGDMGGGSLELVDLRLGAVGHQVTLPLGPLRLGELADSGNRKKLISTIDAHLASLPWLSGLKGRPFYAVGGAWRSIAKAHMELTGYPLHILHEYRIDGTALAGFLGRLQRIGKSGLKSISGISKRRLDTIPLASLVLQRLILMSAPSVVVFSAYGLREGCLYDQLPPEIQALDPLIEAAHEIADVSGRFLPHGEELLDWTTPLFPEEAPQQRRLRHAACILSDMAWTEHPDYRAENAFWKVLRAPIPGFDHAGRCFVALALMARYVGHVDLKAAETAKQLIDKDLVQQALILGVALRLAHTFTGGAPGILPATPLRVIAGKLFFTVTETHEALLGDVVQRRLESLGSVLGQPAEVSAG